MAIITTLYQSKEALSVGDFDKYTAIVTNTAVTPVTGAILTVDIPNNLRLKKNCVFVTDNAYTFRPFPYTLSSGELSITLPTIPASGTVLVSFVFEKVCMDRNINTYSVQVEIGEVLSNVVVAQNKCETCGCCGCNACGRQQV